MHSHKVIVARLLPHHVSSQHQKQQPRRQCSSKLQPWAADQQHAKVPMHKETTKLNFEKYQYKPQIQPSPRNGAGLESLCSSPATALAKQRLVKAQGQPSQPRDTA
jgi:hypothetical protein